MAPNTAIGFLLAALALLLSRNVTRRATGIVIQIATFVALGIGLTRLVGYAIQLELLYSWFQTARMALYTAVGMVVLAVGLWSMWYREPWYASNTYFRADEKIAFLGAGLLVVIGLTTGVAGFAAQQVTLEAALGETLNQDVRNRMATFRSEVSGKTARTRAMAQWLGTGADETGPRDLGAWKVAAESLLADSASSVSIFDHDRRLLLEMGNASTAPVLEVVLASRESFLLWDGGLLLRTSAPMALEDRRVGLLVVVDRMPLSTAHLGEANLCFPQASRLACFPQLPNPRVYTIDRKSPNGKPTPMTLAVAGKQGLVKGLDYRGRNVIASYAPLNAGELGLVVKQDTSELFLPVRNQLRWTVPLLILPVGAGAVLLRRQVTPLALRLFEAQRESSDKEARIRAVVGKVADAIVTMNAGGIIQSFNSAATAMFGYTEAEAIGANVAMLMPPEMRPQHDAGMQRYFAGGGARVVGRGNVQLPGLHKDGHVFELELAVTSI